MLFRSYGYMPQQSQYGQGGIFGGRFGGGGYGGFGGGYGGFGGGYGGGFGGGFQDGLDYGTPGIGWTPRNTGVATNPNTTIAPNTGGTTRTAPIDYDTMVTNAYSGIGRTGFGDTGNTIDRAGYDWWTNQLKSGAISPNDFNARFRAGIPNQNVTTNPQYTNDLTQIYQSELGRAPDAGGLQFYQNLANQGTSLQEIARQISASQEGMQYDPTGGISYGATNTGANNVDYGNAADGGIASLMGFRKRK